MKEIRDLLDEFISSGDELKRMVPTYSYDGRENLRHRMDQHLVDFSRLLELIDEGTMGIGDLQDLLDAAKEFRSTVFSARSALTMALLNSKKKTNSMQDGFSKKASCLVDLAQQWLEESCS